MTSCYDAFMRITLTFDDAIAKALQDLARTPRRSFDEVVNETLRDRLHAQATPDVMPYQVKPAALGGPLPGIDLNMARALADGIEDQEIAARNKLRRSS